MDVWNELIQSWTRSADKRIDVLVNWKVLVGIAARNPRHLHFLIFVVSFDPALPLAGKERGKKEGTRALSQTIPSFPHKYSYRDVSSFAISPLTYRCVLSMWYMCREKSYEMLITEIKTGDARSQNPPATVFHFILWMYGVRVVGRNENISLTNIPSVDLLWE